MEDNPLRFLQSDVNYIKLIENINKRKPTNIFTPPMSGIAHLISNIAVDINKNILYITDNPLDSIKQFIEDFIIIYADNYKTSSLPTLYNSPYSKILPPLFKAKERMTTYQLLLSSKKKIIIVNPLSLLLPIPRFETLNGYFLRIHKGMNTERNFIINKLKIFGYKETDIVNYEGEFSIRGHIIDVFPINQSQPIRIDFEDDEIFSIRYFDTSTQISKDKSSELTIFSIHEFLDDSERELLKPIIKERWDKFHLKEKFKTLNSYWEDNLYYLREELFRVFIMENKQSEFFNDYLIISDFQDSDNDISEIKNRWEKLYETTKELDLAIDYELFFNNEFINRINNPDILFTPLSSAETLYFNYKEIEKKSFNFENHIKEFNNEINLIFTIDNNKKEAIIKKIDELFLKNLIFIPFKIRTGFNYKEYKINFIPIGYILPEKAEENINRENYSVFFSRFQDLKEGDIVVHANYGIAEYKGIKKEKINGVYNDFLLLEYAGGDKVYVSIDAFSLIYRYSGTEDYKPPLDKLGSKSWSKTKEKVKKGIFKIAGDLLKLYAKRKTYQGLSLIPHKESEDEFISLFEHESTKDQIRSWIEISEDMKTDKPMDRLLCGDVGFGKTEIAMRAVFRAVTNNKQVAVLCPTTILANQHYRTFKKRFENYPFEISLLSRMVSTSKRKKIIDKIEKGEIDILIGTHSILSDSIKFNDLALLIIDEEQRFGVKHKNKILKLKEKIDVLTMTATPIPRTLNMAISGVKNLSIIETPPHGRMSIATYIEEINPDIIKEAICTELKRNGQVFIVYNNIGKILSFKEYVENLTPDAKIEYIHSKMNSSLIEKTMLKFINNEFNVLISTTIIENGIDIPNVNTLIVMEAENFGLSQLYQLRGRVGRGSRKAYAYFLINSHRLLTDKAKKRLKALKEFQDLGSGFRLAAMDLEIRGAGNLLGQEQHGHLKSVGFEYYLWLLNRAIKKQKGETSEEDDFQPEISLPYPYSIPDEYIPQSSQRLNLYKRFSLIKDDSELNKITDEIIDRFGNPPKEIYNLAFMVKIRISAKRLKIEKISYNLKNMKIRIKFSPLTPLSEEQIIDIIKIRNIGSLFFYNFFYREILQY
jgi:transcription-repair coupling factor (superfamily II helicase)